MKLKHSLFRLSNSIWNKPHLITPEAFSVVLDYLDTRNHEVFLSNPNDLSPMVGNKENSDNYEGADGTEEDEDSSLAVINVDGTLTYQPINTMCGEVGCSYQALVSQFEAAIDKGASTIVMNITSGGGEAGHVFESASDIRSMCDAAGVKLIAYADTLACSAAYAFACMADTVVANPSATVGSIGCVVCLTNDSGAMTKAGITRTFITSGSAKVPFDAEGAFTQSFLDDLQAEVDGLNAQFTAFVSQYTDIPTDTILGWQAKTFNAQAALEAGLVNSVMTNKEFAKYVAATHSGGSNA